jgi:ABC-2 type transport system permease protein
MNCSFPGGDTVTNDVSVMEKFVEAYKQDVLEHYKFSYIKETSAIGEVDFENDPYTSYVMPVYKDFTRTIDVLAKNDLYKGNEYPVDKIQELMVTDDFPGYNFSEMSVEEQKEIYDKWCYDGKDFGFNVETYTDKDKIKEIMENCILEDYIEWEYPFDKVDKKFTVSFDDKYQDVFTYHYSFKKGSVPKFVYEDFNK